MLLSGAAVLLATVAVLAIGPRSCDASTSHASATLLDCMLASDSGCMLRYVGEEERDVGSVDAASLDRFVRTVWAPHLAGFEPAVRAGQREHGQSHLDMVELRHPDGRRVPVVAVAVAADGRAIHPNLVLDMTITSLLAGRRAGLPLPQGSSAEAYLAEELRRRLREFEGSGLRGAALPVAETGESKFYSWRDLAARFERRAALFHRLPTLSDEEKAAALAEYQDWEKSGP